jgi:hypothetical protein
VGTYSPASGTFDATSTVLNLNNPNETVLKLFEL